MDDSMTPTDNGWMETMDSFENINNSWSWFLSPNLTEFENVSLLDNLTFDFTNFTAHLENNILSYSLTQAIFYIEYFTIFLLGIFGNCLVCYVVFRNKAMHTVTNYFIANLALADILLCVLAVPFTPLYTFMGEWLFGNVLCHLVTMAQGTSVYVSSLTLTSIAIDRFFVILYPFRPRMKVSTCYLIIFCVWLFSLSSTFPYALYMGQVEFQGKFYCEELWPSESIRQVFSGFTAVMQFVVPFIIILYCYVKISFRMNQRSKAKPGSKNLKKEEADRERKRRMNRMLIAMVTIFGVSWLPVNLVHLVGDYYAPASAWEYYNLCFFITHVIAMSSTCYNPFLYAWLNDNFRKEFQLVLPCFKKKAAGHKGNHGSRAEKTLCNGNAKDEQLKRNPSAKDFEVEVDRENQKQPPRKQSVGTNGSKTDNQALEGGSKEPELQELISFQGHSKENPPPGSSTVEDRSSEDNPLEDENPEECHQMKTFFIDMSSQENSTSVDPASRLLDVGPETSDYI